MRLFSGLSIPDNIAAALGSVLAELRKTAQLRWSPVKNLHITSKFIGEWPQERLTELQGALAGLEPPRPFQVTVARFGFLPNPHRPKIFFAGVHGEAGLAQLAERIDIALAAIGVKREDRDYTPHLTLARIRDEEIGMLRERIAAVPVPEFGSFTVREFHLYLSKPDLSKPGPAGSVYSILHTYPLEKAAS
jgi:2'-5' RNA ligase